MTRWLRDWQTRMSNKLARTIVARGLTASDRGSFVRLADGTEGVVQAVEWFDNTSVVTLTVTVDLPNMQKLQVFDQ